MSVAPEAVYGYLGELGEELRKLRLPGKRFVWEHRNGDGGWKPGAGGLHPRLYRVEEAKHAASVGEPIYLVAGEKDADRAWDEGVAATTSPHGEGRTKFKKSHANDLRGAVEVVIVRDNDPVGREDALAKEKLLRGVGVPFRHARARKGLNDLSDHLDAGHGIDTLVFAPPNEKPKAKKPKPKPKTKASRKAAIPKGARNDTLYGAARKMAKAGLGPNQIGAALDALNADCKEPLPADELAGIVKSACTNTGSAAGRRVSAVTLSTVPVQATVWLWKPRIPVGALTILVGQQGTGKSTLTCDLAAKVTRGDLDGDLLGTPRDVVLISYEDHAAGTIVPRLEAAGADRSRVHLVVAERDGQRDLFGLPDDVPALAEIVAEHDAALVVIDPTLAGVGAGTDTHRDADTRRVLVPLAQMAEELEVAVLGLAHFTKSGEADALARTTGSVAVTAAARGVLAFARDPTDEDPRSRRRVLAHAKSNLGPLAPSLAYHLLGTQVPDANGELVETSQVHEVGVSVVAADDLLIRSSPEDRSKTADAEVFLRGELADGPRKSADLKASAKTAGVDWAACNRAKTKLGVVSDCKGTGIGSNKWWQWRFPEEGDPPRKPKARRRRTKTTKRRAR